MIVTLGINTFYSRFPSYRLLIPLQTIVEEEGVDVLLQYDNDGHTPIHWIALGGHSHIMQYITQLKVGSCLVFII